MSSYLSGTTGVLAAGVLLAACTSSGSATPGGDALLMQRVPAHVTVTTTRVPQLGSVLTDSAGQVLYMFPPDAGSRVSCVGACAGTWPPLAVADGATPAAAGGVNAQDLSTLADPNTGARIVTYFGYPLYRYAGDVRPDQANGQALFNYGGPWYAVSADGQPVTIDPTERK
jgi:predicted lipoprotein with Yx(FWY)xxD motif